MDRRLKYTFVMPLFNSEAWMDKAIQSVFAQTYTNWELICVDDGSSDDTLVKIVTYAQMDKERVRYFSQINSGPAVARETAILNATGDYIVFLDSDDYVESNYLKEIDAFSGDKPDIIIPELMSQSKDQNFYSFNAKNALEKGRVFSGIDAFYSTFPWKIHAFACYEISLMKRFAVGENANFNKFNSDEYITRVLFLNSSCIVVSGGKYFHTANFDSLTKKPSLRKLDFLRTEEKLIVLTEEQAPSFLNHVKSESLRKLFSSYVNFKVRQALFSQDEMQFIKQKHITHYKNLKKASFRYVFDSQYPLYKNLIYFLFGYFYSVTTLASFVKRIKK